MKICSKCAVPQPLDAFSIDRTKKDGKQSQCKACNAGYNAARAAYRAAYRAANHEKLAAYNAAYCAANREKRAACSAAWMAKQHPLYTTWRGMRKRCNNPNHVYYHYYGGRGISVCERWDSFESFLSDVGERPEGTTLDRVNNDGNYEPSNVRWATPSEQQRNKRRRVA